MDKIFSELSRLPNKTQEKVKKLSKLFCELESCIDFYINKTFKHHCCLTKNHCEIIELLRLCKRRK